VTVELFVTASIDVTTAIRYVVDGVTLGSIYALVSLGLALVFGMMGMINFAHGSLIVAGAYTLYMAIDVVAWPVALLITVLVTAALALALERGAFRPARHADPITLLVTSFALGFVIQNIVVLAWGSRAKSVAGLPDFLSESFTIGSVDIPWFDVVTLGLTIAAVTVLVIFLTRSSKGLQMLAAARDFDMARLVGVKADGVIALAFAISGLLAGPVAFLLVAPSGSMTPNMGVQPLLIAFAGTVIGGMGSLVGATLGGFGLGFVTTMLQVALPESLKPFRDAFVFGIVLVFLLIRPQGLIPGRHFTERV
jgi:branched-chain amino acid transport system permease protein